MNTQGQAATLPEGETSPSANGSSQATPSSERPRRRRNRGKRTAVTAVSSSLPDRLFGELTVSAAVARALEEMGYDPFSYHLLPKVLLV